MVRRKRRKNEFEVNEHITTTTAPKPIITLTNITYPYSPLYSPPNLHFTPPLMSPLLSLYSLHCHSPVMWLGVTDTCAPMQRVGKCSEEPY